VNDSKLWALDTLKGAISRIDVSHMATLDHCGPHD